jgi:hypothetical protein
MRRRVLVEVQHLCGSADSVKFRLPLQDILSLNSNEVLSRNTDRRFGFAFVSFLVDLPESRAERRTNQRCDIDGILSAIHFESSVKISVEIHSDAYRVDCHDE